MAGFTGPTTLGGLPFQGQSNDPVTQAILSRFPQLRPQSGGGNALQGYQFPGIDFGTGQGGLGSLNLFEGAKGSQAESITGGLALGTLGKSSSQASQVAQPGAGLGMLPSLPQPQFADVGPVPQQTFDFAAGSDGQAPGGSVDLGALVNAGAGEFNFLKGAQTFDPLGQMQTPAAQQQRIGERTDYSNATGSPGGIPQIPLPTVGGGFSGGGVGPSPVGDFMLGPGAFSTASPQIGAPGTGGFGSGGIGPVPTGDSILGTGELMTAPGGRAEFALGNGGGTGQTDFLGAAQSGIGALGGLYNLAGGIAQGNALGATGGALQALGGGAGFLQSVPGLAETLGVSGGALQGVGGAVGGIGGLYSLYQGIQSGDPVQMATGLLGAYTGGASLYGAITGTTAPGILTGFATIAPETSAAVASALSGTEVAASAGAEAIAGTISAAAAAWALPVAAVIQAIMDTIAESERQRVQNAGFTNNPIKGALYSAATESVGGVNDMLKQFSIGGDLSGKSIYDLGQALNVGVNNLIPYYATAQGGRGAIKASDTITGAGADWAAKPYMGGQTPEQYTQNYTQARQGVVDLVNELMKRGVTYEQLGQLPISGDWTQASLDAGGTPQELMQRAIALRPELGAEANQLYGQLGMANYDPYRGAFGSDTSWQSDFGDINTPEGQRNFLLSRVLGSSMLAPESVTHASGLMTQMYGGPLWTALARMGVPDTNIQSLITQHFDPWINARDPAFQQAQVGGRYTEGDIANFEAQHGPGSAAQTGLAAGGLIGGPVQSTIPAAAPNYWDSLQGQQAQQYQQQLNDYNAQLDAFFRNALTPQPLALPTVETAGLLPSSTTAGFAPSTITGGGLTAEQLEWLRSQGWLAQ